MLITDPSAFDPYTHRAGLTDAPARVTSVQTDLAKMRVKISYDLSAQPTYGWAPAVLVLGGEADTDDDIVTLDIATETTAHAFSASTDRLDASWFDCIDWDASSGTYTARGCSCDDYTVYVFEHNNAAATVYTATCEIVGTDLILHSSDLADNWQELVTYVVIYGHWDDIEDCQKLFVVAAGADGSVGTAGDQPRRWT
jgi:hypothetical protein